MIEAILKPLFDILPYFNGISKIKIVGKFDIHNFSAFCKHFKNNKSVYNLDIYDAILEDEHFDIMLDHLYITHLTD